MNNCFMFLLFGLCGSIVPLLIGCDSTKAPRVTFEKNTHEFTRTLIAGSKIETTFTFNNTGNGFLEIKKLEADCGCVVTNTSTNQIPPGGSGGVRVEIDRDPGYFLQNVHVYTNDPAQPIVRLKVRGKILPALAYPNKINLGQLERGQHVSKAVMIANNTEIAVEITEYKASNNSITVKIPKKIIPAKSRVVVDVVLPINEVGFYNEALMFFVQTPVGFPNSDIGRIELSIQFQGRVLGGIVVLPQNLFLGVLNDSGTPIERTLQIRSDGNQPFVLKQISADIFSVDASLPTSPDTAHEVVLLIKQNTVRKSPTSRLNEGTIRIVTSHPYTPEITIPVKAVHP